jgi:tetratricopeptide (TPR) repeat protein
MRCFKYLVFVFTILVLMTSCSKKQMKLIDDTWYIIDDYAILMLIKTSEQDSYKDLMVQLKGNGESLKETIETLREIEQDVSIKNALGIGYLRLRMFQKAYSSFQEALNIVNSNEDRACLLSNLSEVMWYQEKPESARNYLEEALKMEIEDPLKKLILQSNLEAMELSNKDNYVHEIAVIKDLIKQERRIIGSNQFVGIFNYKTLGYACYLTGNMKRCDYYINKAFDLNHKSYQYVYIDAGLYKILSQMYSTVDLNKALDYVNENIELLEKWQIGDHYDLLDLYELRGNIYLNLHQFKEHLAIKDYEYVLEQCLPYNDLAAVSYYNLAYAYDYLGDENRVIESYARAYYIWNREGYEDSNQEIEEALRKIYEKQINKSDDYESWYQTQIIQAKEDLRKMWGE